MTERVDVVVVGAGPAGLAAAWALAELGFEVVVVERGDYAGSKNVSGGRLYLRPLAPYFPPDFWQGAPFERTVTRELVTVVGSAGAATLDFRGDRFASPPPHSVTVLRARLDRWLAEKAAASGAMVVSGYRVDGLLREGTRVVGVTAGEAELRCDVVVAADGALSFMAEQAGLRGRLQAKNYALAVKEIIELPPGVIEARFGLAPGQGVAQLFFGTLSQGMFGGGFLYTNHDSLSLGMVVSVHDLSTREPAIEAPSLLESLENLPEVAPLIANGHRVEYSAHLIPEGGYHGLHRLWGEGILLVGDAAGFALNTGLLVRGMDFALASGVIAARSIQAARSEPAEKADRLAVYERLLADSFVLRDLKTFRHAPQVLSNPRLISRYPELVLRILDQLFWLGEEPKPRLASTVLGELRRSLSPVDALRDLASLRKL